MADAEKAHNNDGMFDIVPVVATTATSSSSSSSGAVSAADRISDKDASTDGCDEFRRGSSVVALDMLVIILSLFVVRR